MFNRKPVIAIIAKHNSIEKLRQKSVIKDEIKDVIFYNGGILIGIFCPREEVKFLSHKSYVTNQELDNMLSKKEQGIFAEQISMCDGVILSGTQLLWIRLIWTLRQEMMMEILR